MSAIFEAHLRMLATLPVRTHERAEPVKRMDTSPKPLVRFRARRLRIRQLLAQGVSKERIRILLGISRSTMFRHQRAIKRGK
jgi:DNA-binding NarL/FixJ family response regulator